MTNQIILFLIISTSVIVGLNTYASEATKKPNIILLLSDDHSFPNLGCYGDENAKTPFLNKLAAEGMLFERAYTMSPQCVPSRASIMTGRSPIDVDMTRFSAPLEENVPIFPEILRKNGYFTAVMGRYFHLDGPFPGRRSRGAVKHRFDLTQINNWNRKDFGDPVKILDRIKEKKGDKPFFLWVNFHEPHRRWVEPEQRGWDWKPQQNRPDPKDIEILPDMPDTELLRKDMTDFYMVLNALDQRCGRIMKKIDEMGIKENTIVIFMGDNGAAFLRGKGTLYDRGIRVPLIIRWPGKIKPGKTNDLISGNDLAPTLLSAAGIKAPKEMTGNNFLGLITDSKGYKARGAVFSERGTHGYGTPTSTMYFDQSRNITTQRYSYIYNATWQLPYEPVDIGDYGVPFWKELVNLNKEGKVEEPYKSLLFSKKRSMYELYDLVKDPYQLSNLAGIKEHEAVEKDLRTRLAQWMIKERDFLPLPKNIK